MLETSLLSGNGPAGLASAIGRGCVKTQISWEIVGRETPTDIEKIEYGSI